MVEIKFVFAPQILLGVIDDKVTSKHCNNDGYLHFESNDKTQAFSQLSRIKLE